MKLYRFHYCGHSYGYIKANFIECLILKARIAGGDTGLESVESRAKELGRKPPGPLNYGAQFIITKKKKKSKCQLYVDGIKEQQRKQRKPLTRKTWNLFGIFVEWRIKLVNFK